MIGIRPLLSAATVAVALVAGLGGGAPRPEIDLGARRLVVQRAEIADGRLAALEAELLAAVDAARAGAAHVVAGDVPPAQELLRAAEMTSAADASAADAREAVLRLEAARRAWKPLADPLEPVTDPGELGSIAAQLEAAADAANEFAAMRVRTGAVTGAVRDALAALDAGDLDAARRLLDGARSDHESVAAWEVELVTLPVWLDTADAMIRAVERVVDAIDRNDPASAAAAAEAFAALEDEAATADRAVRIAMSEGGAAVTAAPLERLGSVLSSITELRSTLAAVRAAAS
jgi:hypothetical protein